MATYALKAQTREAIGKKVKKVRDQGVVPAVLYGHDVVNQNLVVNAMEFVKLYDQTGESKLVDLVIDDKKPVKTLIYDVQYSPVRNEVNHVDFYQIKEGEKITTEIELNFIGDAPAVKEFGGVLVKNYDAVEIECLPSDLEKMDELEVDLTSLKTLEDAIHIKDLKTPAGVKILVEPEEVVAMVEQIAEEKVEEVKTIESVEGIVKEKKTDEEDPGTDDKKEEKK